MLNDGTINMTRLSYQQYQDQATEKVKMQLLDQYEDQYAHLFKDGRFPKELFEFYKMNGTAITRNRDWKGQNNLNKIIIGNTVNYTQNQNDKPDLNEIDLL